MIARSECGGASASSQASAVRPRDRQRVTCAAASLSSDPPSPSPPSLPGFCAVPRRPLPGGGPGPHFSMFHSFSPPSHPTRSGVAVAPMAVTGRGTGELSTSCLTARGRQDKRSSPRGGRFFLGPELWPGPALKRKWGARFLCRRHFLWVRRVLARLGVACEHVGVRSACRACAARVQGVQGTCASALGHTGRRHTLPGRAVSCLQTPAL